MFTPLKTLLIAGGLALGIVGTSASMAQAGTRGAITFGSPEFSITIGNGVQQAHHTGVRRNRHYGRARFCTPRRALRKAARRGIRNVHIRRVNGRRIVVAGRARGERVVIGMGRHRSCPVHFVRAGGRRGGINRTSIDQPVIVERQGRRGNGQRRRNR